MTKRKVEATAYIAIGWYDGSIVGEVAGSKIDAMDNYENNFERKHVELFSIEMSKEQDDKVVELKRV